MTYISWSSDFALYLRLLDVWISYFEIMSRYDPTFDLEINVGHCDLYFMVQWFCLISLRLFDVWTSYFRIMSQYDMTFDLKINIGHCDLYFMVQWFCLISWRLFVIWTPYFGIMSQYDLRVVKIRWLLAHSATYSSDWHWKMFFLYPPAFMPRGI